MAMLSAILEKDPKPTGVTDKTVELAATMPPIRMPGSNMPWTTMSLPKISAMELRYSGSVRRRSATTLSLLAAAQTATPELTQTRKATAVSMTLLRTRPPKQPSGRL